NPVDQLMAVLTKFVIGHGQFPINSMRHRGSCLASRVPCFRGTPRKHVGYRRPACFRAKRSKAWHPSNHSLVHLAYKCQAYSLISQSVTCARKRFASADLMATKSATSASPIALVSHSSRSSASRASSSRIGNRFALSLLGWHNSPLSPLLGAKGKVRGPRA